MEPSSPHGDAARRMAADCLCFRARRVSRLLTRLYDEALRPLGILATQLTLMNAITMTGERGAPLARLSDVLALDPTTLSRNLKALERGGLVRLQRLPADRRARVVFLTPAGERRVAEALPHWEAAHARIVSLLGAEGAADLKDRFDVAAARAGEADGRAAAAADETLRASATSKGG
jgi:DNA-binding MarR family transcriptional regulator